MSVNARRRKPSYGREVGDDQPEAGHAAQVERLYRAEAPRLWRAIRAFTGDPELTNDVVAETFAQVLRRGPAVRSPERWIWRTAFLIARGQLKERGAAAQVEEEEIVDPPDTRSELAWALLQLTPRQRAVVVLRHYMGYSSTEIARILGSAAPTVRVHLARGLRRLRSLLKEDSGES
jgi:RNA polymerase sigma factor (sigma-70 family)